MNIAAFTCRSCGYDLRATALGGNCPECGTPVLQASDSMRVEGKYLVVRSGATLPHRCIKTNQGTDIKQKTKTVYWFSPWCYLAIIQILLCLVIILLTRKPCSITYSISAQSKQDKIKRILIGLGFVVLGIATFFGTAFIPGTTGFLILLGLAMLITGLILSISASNDVTAAKHKNGDFWIKGCCPEFLAQLQAELDAGRR